MAITIPIVYSNEMIEDNNEENGSMLQKSASQQYPSFESSSSNFDQRNEEFGLRKSNPFESHQMNMDNNDGDYSTQQSQHQYDTSMNDGQNNNNNNNGDSSMQSPYREFGPSIYNMHTMNGGDTQSYGQNDGSESNQESGSFTPVSLSVDEAFRKYFPNEKDAQDGPYSQQSQGQSMDGYSNQQANGDKGVVNIDSIREIVEKQPLARPDPFDPPSPPLSAFLPPPPNSQLVESSGSQQPDQHQYQQAMASQTTLPEQIAANMPQSDSGSSQAYMNQAHPQIPIQPINTFKAQEPDMPQSSFINPPPMMSQPPPSKFSFSKDSIISIDNGNNDNDNNNDSGLSDENEDEGYAYNTENIDENGKKVLVYQRPVDLPELNTGNKFDIYGQSGHTGQSSNQEISSIYHKQNDQSLSSMDQGMNIQDSLMNNDNYKYQNEITIQRDKQSMDNDMFQMNPIDMRPPPPPPSFFTDFTDYEPSGHSFQNQPQPSHQSEQRHQQQQQHQQSWTPQNHNNMPSMDFGGGKMTEGLQQIEYGGFVPIKKPHISNSDMNNQQPLNGGDYMVQNGPQSKAPYEYNANNNVEYVQQPLPSPQPQMGNMIQITPSSPQQGSQSMPPSQQSKQTFRQNLNFESEYHGPGSFNEPPSIFDTPNIHHNYLPLSAPSSHQQQMSTQNGGGYPQEHEHFHVNKIHDIHVKPLYGKDATKKLRELGINEDEFYGTVNKILQKSRPMGKPNKHFETSSSRMPLLPPYLPKVNLYRAPPKNRPRPFGNNGRKKNRFYHNNLIAEDIELKFLKDELPPGASYNPRDVGLDESVLAQLHLLDSGIGGYRFPGPMSNGQHSHHRPLFRKPSVPYKKSNAAASSSGSSGGSGPHAMNSMIMPFIYQSSNAQHNTNRSPHSTSSITRNKGFYPAYGYRAAASELKPQFILPKGKHFKFLHQKQQQKITPTDSSNLNLFLSPSSSTSSSSATTIDGGQRPLANIFGIRSIKGIRSLVSYLTGGVSG
ncbi:hypothetical protein DERF_013512 [Dermatophagoides farinae]|uniref:Uncharacterized protein n=1 Tax=Dermatophagoides farinae TaxID=6954 RepID=A0A922KYP2_DERFA|nr:hypothetical protein DERF_013512 [Dermatophagoides farinae]